MVDKTVIYYTHNREKPYLEEMVLNNILSTKGDLPLISVSQKPMPDFGHNICVGDVGSSYVNEFRQLRIGLDAATTDYVVCTESDCLYPSSGYFDFIPTDLRTVYNYDNVWMVNKKLNRYFKRPSTHGSVIFGRLFLMEIIDRSLAGLPLWTREKLRFPYFLPSDPWENFTGLPLLNIKSGDGVNGCKGGWDKTAPRPYTIPYWGDFSKVKTMVFGNE